MKTNFLVGQNYTEEFFIDQNVVDKFAELSGDKNPIHINRDFAKKSIFGNTIVHGIYIASLFSKILGNNLPGKGSIYLGQSLKFIKPIFVNEKVKIDVSIINIREDKPIITLRTICYNSNNEIAVDGEAVMKILL